MTARDSLTKLHGSVFVFPDDYIQKERVKGQGKVPHREEQEFLEPAGSLRELDMVFRKAEESAKRRFLAASWIQEMVGPLNIPAEPSEEEFRLCLRNGLSLCRLVNSIQPGAVQKVVESPPTIPAEGALSAYQYFENVRNFLVSVEDLNMPTFEASDLEETSFVTGSVAKVVDCILALKSYHEWKQNGGVGQWKHGVKSHLENESYAKSILTFSLDEAGKCVLTNSNPINANNTRKRCILPDVDFLGETQLLLPEEPADLVVSEAMGQWDNQVFDASVDTALSDCIPKQESMDHEKGTCQLLLGSCRLFNGIEAQSPTSLSNTVRAVLSEKQPEEIPMVVEFMLQKVMEDYRRRFLAQGLQLKKLKSALKEALTQGSDQPPTASCLDLLEDGTGNDGQAIFNQLQLIKELKEASHNTRHEVLDMRHKLNKELQHLESQLQGLAAAAAGYQRVLEENRKLYNEVQDLKGSIRVYCRVRPLLSGNLERKTTVEFIGENGDIMISNPKKQGKDACRTFKFNKVFGTSASQEEVFLDTRPLIRSVLDGYNVCIFAYGQTGSGKTFTMSGPFNAAENLWGVNFRALNDLFHISQSRKAICRYEIGVQMVEIYNEQVRDLLASDGPTKKLEIRNNSQQNGLNVPDASMLAVTSTLDVLELMKAGQRNRAIGATALNERSSRSHSVLTIHVQGKDLVSGSVLRGCLHLIDLAGSERVNKSEATGDRLKEAQHINKSLSALGDVISALSQKNAHVPYRNSKLTQLLQDSLGGQAKTLMFVHINPDVDSSGETMSTLKFAERVASIELGAARSNKETSELRELKEQIMALKDSLSKKDADLDKLLVLRNVKASEQISSIEKQKRRQSVEDHEAKTRKQFMEGVKAREGSPPVRDRVRRYSPPGNSFGFTQGDLERVLSPSKGEAYLEQQKKKSNKSKQPVASPKSPEEFAPKSPYRERHPRLKSKSIADSQNRTKTSSVFLVDSPPCQDERLKSPDVDGLINKEAELSRDSPVLPSPSYDPPRSTTLITYSNDHSGEFSAEGMPMICSGPLRSTSSSPELKETGSDIDGDNMQSSETVERVATISGTVYSMQQMAPPAEVVEESHQQLEAKSIQKRSPMQKPNLSKSNRKVQSVSYVRRRSVISSRTEGPSIKRSTNLIPCTLGC